MWHFVYLSFESTSSGRSYIGKHSTNDLYDGYLGSFSDIDFKPDSRIILGYYKTKETAIAAEIQWQKAFQVSTSEFFANKSYQTSTGFDRTGVCHTEGAKQKMKEASREFDPSLYRTALGKHWFHNPTTKQEVLDFSCPKGFIPGRVSMVIKNPGKNKSEETRSKISLAQKQIPREDRYWYGKEGNASGTYWWRNPETGETKRSKTQPGPSWTLGRNDSQPVSNRSAKNRHLPKSGKQCCLPDFGFSGREWRGCGESEEDYPGS